MHWRRRSILLICLAEIMAMSTWFSTSSVMAQWRELFALSHLWAGTITSATSVGFVLGAVGLAVTGIPDRFDSRRIFALAALVGAGANAASLFIHPESMATLLLRLVVGACAAGIYPIGMRLVSTWSTGNTGLLVGLLVGAQVVGLSLPYLVDVLGGLDWHATIMATSIASAGAALIVSAAQVGPNFLPAGEFNIRDLYALWSNKAIRWMNIGYLGHMWELFAMWGWIALFLQHSLAGENPVPHQLQMAKILTFFSVAAGALGCIVAGRLADRHGRAIVITACQILSLGCALTLSIFDTMPLWLLVCICLLWGFVVVADSPQYSAAIVELSPKGLSGTLIVAQVGLGYLLTVISLQIVPIILDLTGWPMVFILMAAGPSATIYCMWRLQKVSREF